MRNTLVICQGLWGGVRTQECDKAGRPSGPPPQALESITGEEAVLRPTGAREQKGTLRGGRWEGTQSGSQF